MLPRRAPMFSDSGDDDLQISELLRTGEASRLRRRGAIHGHGSHPARPSYVTLTCGIPIASGWKFNARNSCQDDEEMNPLPQPLFSRRRTTILANMVEPTTTGCGAVITTRASVSRLCRLFEVAAAADKNVVASLDPTYLDDEQRQMTNSFVQHLWGSHSWIGLGCRACGNVVGFRYRSVPAKAYDSKGQCMFFPSSVTPSKPCIFPEIPRSYASTETPLRTRRTSGYVGSGSRRSLRHPVQGGPAPSHPYSDSRSRTSSSLSDFLDWYASAATRGISLSDEEDERATVVETQADNESSEDMAGEFHPSWTRVLPPFEQRGDDDISGWNIPSPVYEGHSTRSTSEVGHRAQAHRRWHSNEEEVISEADTIWHWMPNENEIHYPVSWVEAAQTEVGEPTGISSGIDNNNNTVTASSAVVEEHGTSERNQDNSPPLSPRPVLWSHRPLHDMVSEAPPAVDSNPLPHGLSEFDLVQIDVSVLSPDIFGHSPESTNGLPTPTSPSPDPPVVNSSAAVASSAVRSSSTVNTPSEAATTPHSPLQPPSVRTPPIASHPRPPRETPPWFDSSRRDRNRSPAPRGGSAPPAVSRPTFHHAHRPIIPPPPPNFFPFLDAIRLRRPRVISHGEGEIREGRSQSRSWRARHNHVMRSREPNEEERRAPRQSEIAQEVQTDSEPESYDTRQELPWPILREYSGVQYHIEPAILRPDVRRSSSLAPSLDSSNSFIRPSLSPTRRMTMPAFLSGRPETAVANENTTSEDSEDSRDSSWWRRSWHDVRTGLEDKDEEVPPDTRHRHSRHREEYLVDGSG